jgi:hypothetical protein
METPLINSTSLCMYSIYGVVTLQFDGKLLGTNHEYFPISIQHVSAAVLKLHLLRSPSADLARLVC